MSYQTFQIHLCLIGHSVFLFSGCVRVAASCRVRNVQIFALRYAMEKFFQPDARLLFRRVWGRVKANWVTAAAKDMWT